MKHWVVIEVIKMKHWVVIEDQNGYFICECLPDTPWSVMRKRYTNFWEAYGAMTMVKAGLRSYYTECFVRKD